MEPYISWRKKCIALFSPRASGVFAVKNVCYESTSMQMFARRGNER